MGRRVQVPVSLIVVASAMTAVWGRVNVSAGALCGSEPAPGQRTLVVGIPSPFDFTACDNEGLPMAHDNSLFAASLGDASKQAEDSFIPARRAFVMTPS